MRRRWKAILLVVVIGVLAAAAVPSVLPQKTRANDAGAKALARTASTAAETIATNDGGSFAHVTLASVVGEEPSITACGSAPCLSAATGTRGSYVVTARSASGDTFTITGNGSSARRTCSGDGCRW
jgi:type II secretory pathway pseudopilin PulG